MSISFHRAPPVRARALCALSHSLSLCSLLSALSRHPPDTRVPRARVSHSAVSASCLVSSVCPVCRAAGECVQRGLQTQVCRDLACYQQISSQPVTSSVRSLFYIITRVAHPTVSTPRQVSLWSVHTADSLSLQLSISPRARARAHTLWGVYTLRRSALGNTLLLSVLLHAHAP